MIEAYYQDDYCTIYHGDCRDILPLLDPVDLVLTDPPYGIDAYKSGMMGGGVLAKQSTYEPTEWDSSPIDWIFLEKTIQRGRNACVWGGNYYPMPPSPSWLVWDKETGKNYFADCELAWTNYGQAVRLKRHRWQGMLRVNNEERCHPTQKPVDIMLWCIENCPGDPQTILDPFMGSGTTLVAAKDLQRQAIGIELEEKYCEVAADRLASFEPLPFSPVEPAPAECLELFADD